MSIEVDDDLFPYSAVTYISSRWGEYIASGTGFIVGKNDVLTAAHVIFDSSKGGLADEVLIYPSYDPDNNTAEAYSVVSFNYYDDFDPNGDGYIISGDNQSFTLAGTEKDIAHLTVIENLESKYGSFGIDTGFSIGEVSVVGYPRKFSYNPIFDNGSVVKDLVDDYFAFSELEVSPGNSGGPIFYDYGTGPYAVGIVSTESAVLSLSGQKIWIEENLKLENYLFQRPYLFISSDVSNVDEGEQIIFSINHFKHEADNSIRYSFQGIDESDILFGVKDGYFEKDSTGSASISLTLASDFKTEGPEKLTLNINESIYSTTINDTSKNIESNSSIYLHGDALNKNFLISDAKKFFQGKSYGFVDFGLGERLEEWIGSDLVYEKNSFYPTTGTLSYVSAFFAENSSFIAASGLLNVNELSSDYSINSVINTFAKTSPNQILGSNKEDILAAFGDGDSVNGMAGNDLFTLSSNESAYRFYNLNASTNSGKIDKGEDITISFTNIENFKFSDKTKTFEYLFEEKMSSILTLSDLVPSSNINFSYSQYIKSVKEDEVFEYEEIVENIIINYIDIDNDLCSFSSSKFGTDTLSGFQRINFSNSSLALDLGQGESTGLVYRLYNTAFSRTPDSEGLNFYIDNIKQLKFSFQSVAESFLNSPEFFSKNGLNLSSGDFIEVLYHNVLKREPSNSEVIWYESRLENSSFSRVDVLLGFSESPENILLLSPMIDEGIWLN